MSAQAELKAPVSVAADEDSAKRRQIIEGARKVFLAQGFDAASMGEIARAAGVSKGTLYVYFKNKEELFAAIVHQECRAQFEGMFDLDANDHDVAAVLTKLGTDLVTFVILSGAVSAMRTVVAIADRMPEIGQQFYETGPARGIAKVAVYLQAQVAAGVLAIEDCELAAAQFLESCQATLFKPALLNLAPPSSERIAHVIGTAVRVFLAAYRAR
jgi:AcrR family transcriptional regulator